MSAALRPLHLLFLNHALAHHLVHRRFDKTRADSLAIAIALAVVRDAGLIREREIPGGLQATTDSNGGGRPDSLLIGLAPGSSVTNDGPPGIFCSRPEAIPAPRADV